MKPLYLSTAVRAGLGSALRPGGTTLTKRILDLAAPTANSMVVDAGCGSGASMELLKDYGIRRIVGFDIDPQLAGEARQKGLDIALADLARLPLPDSCLDLVLCECVWNLTDKKRVTSECARVLRPGG